MAERLTVEVTAADTWKSLADLNSTPGLPVVLTEGFVAAVSNGAYFVAQTFAPAATAVGIPLAAGAVAGVGPVRALDAGWPLAQIWVRNSSAGSNATVVVTGQVA